MTVGTSTSASALEGVQLDDVGASTWFKPEKFSESSQTKEDVHKYVDELRLYVPQGKIKAELEGLLSKLKQELVDLINRDYDDFVNLSTNLVDVNTSVDRIREPLLELRATLLAKKQSVDNELISLNDGLRQRSEVGKAKAILELVQDTTNVVSKVEKLLAEMVVSEDEDGSEVETGKLSAEEVDVRSQHLERISSEYSRLKYYLSKGKGLSFLSNLEDQLKALDSKFFALLDTCASTAFEKRHMPTIQRCINAYNSVGSPKAAEQIFQTAIIRPILAQVLALSFSDSSNPHSQTKSIAEVYAGILDQVQAQAGEIMESINGQLSDNYNSCNIAVAIVAETDKAVSTSMQSIYSPGIPKAFHANYVASVNFLQKVAGYCPSSALKKEFQESSAVRSFLQRWNLTVYNSLMFQDIASRFEKHIAGKEVSMSASGDPFHLSASRVLFECLMRAFAADVFLPSLATKFSRLGFQLVSRYQVWLRAGLVKRRDSATKGDTTGGSGQGDFWAKLTTSDLVMIINDVKMLRAKVSTDLRDLVGEAMRELDPALAAGVVGEIEASAEEAGGVSAIIKDILGGSVLQQCTDLLKHVRGITATYRMTNRPMPSRPSHYVSSVLRPLDDLQKSFRQTQVSPQLMNELRDYVAQKVTIKYDETAVDLLRTVHQTESSLKRLKEKQVSAQGGGQGKDGKASDAEKICLQLFLDVQEYGNQLSRLGVDVNEESNPEYCKLWQTVAPEDKKSVISLTN